MEDAVQIRALPPVRTSAQASRSRIRGLDVLRAVAILLVLGRHFPSPNFAGNRLVGMILTKWNFVGWTGVDLFFVLSGFLVAGILFSELKTTGAIDFRRFLTRRALKIYPPYWLLLIATYVAAVGRPPTISEAAKYLSLTQNYLGFDDILLHTWSLCVEEHFYLLLTLVLYIITRKRKAVGNVEMLTPIICLWVAGAVIFLRIDYSGAHAYSWAKQLTLTHLRIDSLSFGVLLAWVYHFRRPWFDIAVNRFRPLLAVLGVTLLSIFAFYNVDDRWVYIYGFTFTYLGAGALVVAASKTTGLKPNRFAALLADKIGRPSYSIYLWHVLMSYFLAPFLESLKLSSPIINAIFVLFSILLGNLMYALIEIPINTVRSSSRDALKAT